MHGLLCVAWVHEIDWHTRNGMVLPSKDRSAVPARPEGKPDVPSCLYHQSCRRFGLEGLRWSVSLVRAGLGRVSRRTNQGLGNVDRGQGLDSSSSKRCHIPPTDCPAHTLQRRACAALPSRRCRSRPLRPPWRKTALPKAFDPCMSCPSLS